MRVAADLTSGMDSYLCRIGCAKRKEDHFLLLRVDRSFAVKIHAVVRRGVGEVLASFRSMAAVVAQMFLPPE